MSLYKTKKWISFHNIQVDLIGLFFAFWLEENNGKFPRSIIRKNGNTLKREKIQKLKSLQQARKNKDIEIKNRMKKAVGKHVKDNEKTRQEIEDMEPKTGKTKNNGFEPSDD